MKAFEKALNNTHNINLAPELVNVFKNSMRLFNAYFIKHNLYDTFNIDKFFDENLFTNKSLKHDKLKINYNKLENDNPNSNHSISKGVRGVYFLNGNLLIMNEMLRSDFDRTLESLILGSWENSLISNFVHEFSHFLTMAGNMEYKDNNKVKTTTFHNQFGFMFKPYLNEMLTERFKTKIVGEQMLNYNPIVLPFKLIENVFNLDVNKAFLSRSYEEFIDKMGYKNFKIFDEAMTNVFLQFKNDPDRLNFDKELAPVINLAFEKIYNDLDNKKFSLTPTEFLDIRTNLYYLLPFKSYSKYGKVLNELNEKYASFYLSKHNAPLTKESVAEVAKILSNASKAASAIAVEQNYDLDKFLRVKLSNVTINMFIKDGKLFTYNHDIEDYFRTKDFAFIINQNSTEQKLFDKTYPCLQDYDVRYVKHSPNDVCIYEYDSKVPENEHGEHNYNKKISLSFNGSIITLKGAEKEVVFDVFDKQNEHILDSLNNNLQNKVQELKQSEPLLLR